MFYTMQRLISDGIRRRILLEIPERDRFNQKEEQTVSKLHKNVQKTLLS